MQNLIIVLIASYFFNAISLWKLFAFAGKDSWKAFVPIYNRYTQLEILNRPKWWTLILLIPTVGAIFHFVLHSDFIRCYDKRKFTDALLVFVTLGLYVTYLNYNKKTQFIGVEERKETFVASILFAVIFATVIHTFIAQPFIIPTGSMEGTLKVGDFLIVNKMAYGSRIPMTPVSIPFLQNKIPKTAQKPHNQIDSYIDAIRLPYFRFPGYEKIKNNSLVVFNYPTDSSHTAIDRKDPYVKRCVAIPGDTLEIKDGHLFINGKEEVLPKDNERQFSYSVETDGTKITSEFMEKEIDFVSQMREDGRAEYLAENISNDNILNLKNILINNNKLIDSVSKYNNDYIIYSRVNLNKLNEFKESIPELIGSSISQKKIVPLYFFDGLSELKIQKLKSFSFVKNVTKNITPKGIKDEHFYSNQTIDSTNTIFPEDKNWNKDQFGPLYMPKKGDKITLNKDNITQYFNIVNKYEKSNVSIKDQKIWVDGKEVPSYEYTIQQNYYFMIGDNRHNSLDSRYFGYVPEDHIMGKPTFYWMSLQGFFDQGSFKLRTNRMFKVPSNGTPMKDKFNWGWTIIPLIIGFFVWDNRRIKKKKEQKTK